MIRYLLATFLALCCLPLVSAGQSTAPYDVHVELDFTATSGDEEVRDELELQVLSELRRSGCFRSVLRFIPEDAENKAPDREALRLHISVSELFEETVYDTSTAQRTDPMAPRELALLHTSRVHAVLRVALEHPASGLTLRSKRLRGEGAHRPLMEGDDARHRALIEATVSAAQEVRRFVCKGGAKRLEKEIGAASDP